jgi:TetR/AcrR family transcriptional regulator, transcriptional repressor for nem operon
MKSTRDHLIDAGLRLMREHGYYSTGLKEILDLAQVPKGSFYHYFVSKEEFTGALLERYAAREMEQWQGILNDEKYPPLKRLRRYFDELVNVYGQEGPFPGCLIGSLSLELANQSTSIQKLLSASFGYWQHAVAKVLQAAVDYNELPPHTQPESLAGFLLNNWQGAAVRSMAEKSNEPLKCFLYYTFDVLLTKASMLPAVREDKQAVL